MVANLDELAVDSAALVPAPFSIHCKASVVHMPEPRAAVLHAIPIVVEGALAPMALFYAALLIGGFRVALVVALCWSYLATARRVARGERISTLLILGTVLITLRTAVAFATGSAFVYFAQPLAGSVVIAVVLLVSAVLRRPFTQRFAHDFCPLDPDLLAEPRVQQFFVRISLVWAAVLLVNTGVVVWLLMTSSVRAFVLERTAVTWSLTAGAIFCSIYGFVLTMRRDGRSVQWGRRANQADFAAS
ncbi:MAG: VC0807 family protein [Acidimicrobiales bacterium]